MKHVGLALRLLRLRLRVSRQARWVQRRLVG